MPASELGPWGRIYFRIGVDKAHYSLEALGAFLKVWSNMGLVTPRGSLKRRAVVGLIGEPMYAYLVEEGDLIEADGVVTMHRWDWYQAPLEQNRKRQADHRDRTSPPSVDLVDNVTSRDRNVTVTGGSRDVSYSPSPSDSPTTTNEDHPIVDGGDFDALDRFYELTQLRPWGKRSGSWLRELQEKHGIANVVAALEVEHRDDPAGRDLISKVAARLERQAERVAEAKRKEPKPVDPLQAQIRDAMKAHYADDDVEVTPEPTPEAIAAGRAFFERGFGAIVKGLPSGPSAVLPSSQNGSSGNGRSLTVGKGSGREPAAATAQGGRDFGAAPSPGREPGRINAEAEPGEPDPSRSEAPTDGARAKESRR